jgi:hypothetical protein
VKRSARAVLGLFMAVVAMFATLGISSPASAAVQSWSVPTAKLYSNPWYYGGGACYASSYATYDTVSRTFSVSSSAWSTAPTMGCRARVNFTIIALVNGAVQYTPVTQDIPTACSTTDPTCPSRRTIYYTRWFPTGSQVIVVTPYSVVRR